MTCVSDESGTLSGVQSYLQVTQMFVSIVLIALIMTQARSGGLQPGGQDQTSVFRTRRGIEKTLFQFTLIVAVVFVAVSVASVVLVARLAAVPSL